MKIVLIGSVEFSLRALEKLVKLDADVVGVCTKSVSEFNSDKVDLSGFCLTHEIPSLIIDDINSLQAISWIREKSPDVIFCFGWSQLIKQELISLPKVGIIGYHPAALPANRGRHPIIWALALGLKKTASTFFLMDSSVDGGDILSQREINIDGHDDARTLYDKIIKVGLNQIEELFPMLLSGSYAAVKQNLTNSNIWRKRSFLDGRIDWRMTSVSIYNLVRSLTHPYLGAHFMIQGQEVKVWRVLVSQDSLENIEPGKVIMRSEQGIVVKCGAGTITLLETDPPLDCIKGDYL